MAGEDLDAMVERLKALAGSGGEARVDGDEVVLSARLARELIERLEIAEQDSQAITTAAAELVVTRRRIQGRIGRLAIAHAAAPSSRG